MNATEQNELTVPPTNNLPQIEMWADGACSGNPGPGGWSAILVYGTHEKVLIGRHPQTTNNLMELLAVLNGLKAINKPACIKVHTDSRLVIGWMRDGWRRKDYECAGLSAEIDKVIEQGKHQVEWVEVKGHSGDRMNERANSLAQREAQAMKLEWMQMQSQFDAMAHEMESTL